MRLGEVKMELVEFDTLSVPDWVGLIRHDTGAFGAETMGIELRKMAHYVGARDEDGRLRAVLAAAIARVRVDGHDPFEVVGVGGLLVHRDARGAGLGRQVMERMRLVTDGWGPDRAMLFCEPHLRETYGRRGYIELTETVWVDQPSGPMIMPTQAMWRPIRPVAWPPGTIHVDGFPF